MNFDFFLNLRFFSDSFIGLFSNDNFNLHFNFHYLNNLKIIEKRFPKNKDILENINNSYGELYYKSSQIYNHYFFFNSIQKNNKSIPNEFIINNIIKYFISYENFKKVFFNTIKVDSAFSFIWLCRNEYGELFFYRTLSGENPLRYKYFPIICLDISEHSYYLDYNNDYEKYFNIFFNSINWNFFEKNLLL